MDLLMHIRFNHTSPNRQGSKGYGEPSYYEYEYEGYGEEKEKVRGSIDWIS